MATPTTRRETVPMPDMTPFQKRMTEIGVDSLGITDPDFSSPVHLTPMERALYNDSYTSSTTVHDDKCYICNDPDFARMGLPLCRECPECKEKSEGKVLGHIAADDSECTVCGYDEYEEAMNDQAR